MSTPKRARIDRFLRAAGRSYAGMGKDQRGPEAPFHFVQMADTQLGMEAGFLEGGIPARHKKGWAKELELLRKAVAEVNRLKPAFCIVCGDMVDEWPEEERGRTGADLELRARQEKDFKEACSLIHPDIPLLCVCGNHEIGNRPNAMTIKRYTDSFGDDYFSFWCSGIKCLVVNSQLWKDDTDAKEQREAMDKWLDAELEDGTRRMLVFSHVPPFIFSPEEKEEYFNLNKELRKDLLAKLAAKGVVAWFAGHYHRNAGGVYLHEEGHKLEVVVTGAVGTQIVDKPGGEPLGLSGIGGHKIGDEASGIRVVHVLEDGIVHEWKTFADLSSTGGA